MELSKQEADYQVYESKKGPKVAVRLSYQTAMNLAAGDEAVTQAVLAGLKQAIETNEHQQ